MDDESSDSKVRMKLFSIRFRIKFSEFNSRTWVSSPEFQTTNLFIEKKCLGIVLIHNFWFHHNAIRNRLKAFKVKNQLKLFRVEIALGRFKPSKEVLQQTDHLVSDLKTFQWKVKPFETLGQRILGKLLPNEY